MCCRRGGPCIFEAGRPQPAVIVRFGPTDAETFASGTPKLHISRCIEVLHRTCTKDGLWPKPSETTHRRSANVSLAMLHRSAALARRKAIGIVRVYPHGRCVA